MKKQQQYLKPMLAVIAITVAVPMITSAAVRPSYRELHNAAARTTSSEIHNKFTPRDMQLDLFDAKEFRLQRREKYSSLGYLPTVTPNDASSLKKSATQSSVNPCDTTASSVAPAVKKELRFNDLTSAQQIDLRTQLRVGGCPFAVDEGYQKLCEKMLKAQGSKYEVREGLTNSEQ